jgi:hypothetical protein
LAVATVLAAASVAVSGSAPAEAGSLPSTTRLVSRDAAGASVKAPVGLDVALSDNGRFVAFTTTAAVVPSDTNGKKDVYVRDLWAGTTELVSMTDDDKPITGDSTAPAISDDGRFVAFLSTGSNLVADDDKGLADAFVRDRYENTTRWMSPGFGNTLLLAPVSEVAISGDGTAVAFTTSAATVVANDTNGVSDVFVRDTFGSSVERVSVDGAEGQGTSASTTPALSDDGRYVAFSSDSNLAGGTAQTDVYRRDRTAGTTVMVNVKNGGGLPDAGAGAPSISGDGRYVSFGGNATNQVSGDTNGSSDVFVRDMTSSSVIRASLTSTGAQISNGSSAKTEGLSDDGRTVLFASLGQVTPATDAGTDYDLFVRNTATGATRRVSVGPSDPDPDAQQVSGVLDGSGTTAAFPHSKRLTGESFDQAYTNGPVDLGPFLDSSDAISPNFHDFLGRSPSASDTSLWSGRFDTGKASLPTLIATLAADPAFSTKRAPLIRLYWAFFLRRPDPSGLSYWLNRYQGGSSLTTIAQSFAGSNEFKTRYGTLSNQQYVKQVYVNVFNRQPDAGGLAYWTGKLDTRSMTRGAVLVQFSESNEGKRRLAGPTNITLVSLGMLRTTLSASQWAAVYPAVSLGEPQSLAYTAHYLMGTSQYATRYQ